MFHASYVAHELRRRKGRTILTALGLALGVGLVIGIIGVSQGLDDAQGEVLAPLSSVGTDILVTRVVGATSDTSSTSSTASDATTTTTAQAQPGGGPGGRGGGFFGRGGQNDALNQTDTQALLAENRNVITDLASLGAPGSTFTRDFFLSATLLSFPDQAVQQVAEIPGVTSAVPGLVQLAEHQTGTVPQIVATIQTGGETTTQTVRPDPLTDAERAQVQQCLAANGVQGGPPPGGDGGGGGVTGGGGGGGGGGGAFEQCLPERFREFRATFTSPLRTIEQVVNPPQTDIKNESYTAAGIDPANPSVGLVTQEQLTDGKWLDQGAGNEILVNTAYANTKQLSVGSTVPINGTDYQVVGLVQPTLTGSTADIYFPLTTLQNLSGKTGRVTQVLVKASDSASVNQVADQIKQILPGAEVVTTKGLADQVTGSLADARSLAHRLGGALAAIVLLAAFAIAALLTLSSIGKRVREIGTLRAIGWSKARVVRQIVGETMGIGLLGGILGLGVGAAVSAGVRVLSPSLKATTTGVPGLAGSRASELFGQSATAVHTTVTNLSVPLHASTLMLGVAFALIGGLVAGLFGSWRAARLSPAVALRDLG